LRKLDVNIDAQVYLFVPSTDDAASIEDMNYVFSEPLMDHAREKLVRLFQPAKLFLREEDEQTQEV
jgi:hypothetical protein